MTELRKRMIECLQLRGLSERTQEAYTRAVRQLAEHYHKSPDLITEEELRQYFLHIINVKHYSRNTTTIAICGIRFFFEQTLNRNWSLFNIVRPAPEHKLPVILSLEEVREILNRVRLPRYRVCLSTIYACGLRLQEGIRLAVPDIDSARMMIHVRHGKGNKDRYVPLPRRTLELLRDYWSTHRNPVLIFPAEGRDHIDLSKATEPMSKSSVQDAFRAALKQSGIKHLYKVKEPLGRNENALPLQIVAPFVTDLLLRVFKHGGGFKGALYEFVRRCREQSLTPFNRLGKTLGDALSGASKLLELTQALPQGQT